MWFGIIWLVMYVGHRWNKNSFFVIAKICLFSAVVTLFFKLAWPLDLAFAFANKIFQTRWNAREWTFRVALDLFAVYWGMFSALAFIKAKEYGLADSPWFSRARRGAITASVVALAGFFLFELAHVKTDYNNYHPFISFIPILAFVVLRNATSLLRSTSSQFFIFIGRWSERSLFLFVMIESVFLIESLLRRVQFLRDFLVAGECLKADWFLRKGSGCKLIRYRTVPPVYRTRHKRRTHDDSRHTVATDQRRRDLGRLRLRQPPRRPRDF
jgi:hypothetical protein